LQFRSVSPSGKTYFQFVALWENLWEKQKVDGRRKDEEWMLLVGWWDVRGEIWLLVESQAVDKAEKGHQAIEHRLPLASLVHKCGK
jgi:hypothetical protein